MILVDFSQIAIAGIFQFIDDMKKPEEEVENVLRHVILTSVKGLKKQFKNENKELVITIDSKVNGYWRHDLFPQYKFGRGNRTDDGIDWKMVHRVKNKIKDEIKLYLPWKTIEVPRLEADDIIGVLVRYSQEHLTVANGLDDEPVPIMIVSSDSDLFQLHKYPNVKQWSGQQKKQVGPRVTRENSNDLLLRKIAKGESGDGIPSILSPDNAFSEKIRQKPFKEARVLQFIAEGIEACTTDEERTRYIRNKTLIDLEFTPQHLQDLVIVEYNKKIVGNKMKTYEYLAKNKCKMLMEDVDQF